MDKKYKTVMHQCRTLSQILPSRDDVMMARPLWVKAKPVTAAVCSEKVTKQNDDWQDHSLTFPSSPPVARFWPSGEYSTTLMLLKWPCCFRIKLSLCHSQTTSCPREDTPRAIQSPLRFIATLVMVWREKKVFWFDDSVRYFSLNQVINGIITLVPSLQCWHAFSYLFYLLFVDFIQLQKLMWGLK